MSKRIKFRYIDKNQFETLLASLNLESVDSAKEESLLDIYEEAVGLFESDLATRFKVPLKSVSGQDTDKANDHTRLMVQNAVKAKIRQLIGQEQSKNVVIDLNQKFIDVHGQRYNKLVKTLLNHKIPFDLALQDFAEGAKVPVQTIGLARADNELDSTSFNSRDVLF